MTLTRSCSVLARSINCSLIHTTAKQFLDRELADVERIRNLEAELAESGAEVKHLVPSILCITITLLRKDKLEETEETMKKHKSSDARTSLQGSG